MKQVGSIRQRAVSTMARSSYTSAVLPCVVMTMMMALAQGSMATNFVVGGPLFWAVNRYNDPKFYQDWVQSNFPIRSTDTLGIIHRSWTTFCLLSTTRRHIICYSSSACTVRRVCSEGYSCFDLMFVIRAACGFRAEFIWTAGDSVVQLNQPDFDTCNVQHPIAIWAAEMHLVFPLTGYQNRRVYFTSAAPGHCGKGQKFFLDVYPPAWITEWMLQCLLERRGRS